MSKHRKTIYAGRMIMQAIYTVPVGSMSQERRAGKLNATSEAMKKMNFKHSYQKLAAIIAVNFNRGDDVVCLTYSDDNLPNSRARCEADVKLFRRKAARFWKKRGKEFRMCWSIEHKHGDGRWHVHAVINRIGAKDGPLIAAIWGKGEVSVDHLRTDREKNPIVLARYMAKESEERENSRHAWHYTKNCDQPRTEVEKGLPNNTVLHAPKGTMVLEQESHSNEYGSWSYIKFYIADDAPPQVLRRFGLL